MKKLSGKKTAIFCLILSVLLLAVHLYIVIRPVSFGMPYRVTTEYNGYHFEGSITLYSNNTAKTVNTNLEDEVNDFYYYKNGYIFFTLAESLEEYEAEVAIIETDIESAMNNPFYSEEINAFKLICSETDDYALEYKCHGAIAMAIATAIITIVLIGLTVTSFVLYKKSKASN